MQKILSNWFQKEKRSLPWREEPSPYAVWISEVMLQQTQVAVVIPYFKRWMQQFPSIEALAAASLDAVIKAWEGLGYYSRARHLHAGACYVVSQHAGELPKDSLALSKIKGLGPYTIGALRSFAFHQKAAAVDGNVMRVLARYFHISDDLSLPRTIKKFWQIAEELLPDQEPWIFTEALIELGALICTKKPNCSICPLKSSCQSYQQGDSEDLPYRSSRIRSEKLYRMVAVILSGEGKILIKRVQKGQVMSDLHEFPYFDATPTGLKNSELLNCVEKALDLQVSLINTLPMIQHCFTRFSVRLFPYLFDCINFKEVPGYMWVLKDELEKLAFSSGHRRLLHLINISAYK